MPYNDEAPRGNHFSSRTGRKPQSSQPSYGSRPNREAGAPYTNSGGRRGGHFGAPELFEQQPRPATPTIPPFDSSSPSPYRNAKPRKKNRGKRVAAVFGIVLLVLVIAGGVTAFSLYKDATGILSQSQSIMDNASALSSNLKDGDGEALKTNASTLASQVSDIKDTISGPAWTVASFVPVYGDDVRFARGLVDQADNLIQNALLPACDSLANFKLSNLMQDGAINLDLLTSLITTMQSVEPAISESADAISSLPEPHIGKLQELSRKIKDPLDDATSMLKQFNEIAPLLPQMLGANGQTRDYIIAAENNAEIRTQGGFVGSSGVLSITDGRISLGEFESTQTMGDAGPTDLISISDEEMTLFQPYGITLNYTSGDSFFVPDFPRGAQLLSTIWSIKHNEQHIDGVIALDPTFLQYLLQLTGGVTAADGTYVDGTNAAAVLLSDTYWKYPTDGKAQDAVFSSIASEVFDKLLGGLGDMDITALSDVITRGVSEGRILMWMAQEDEQAAMTKLGLEGALPTSVEDVQTGVYVNNYSFSKLDWYLNLNAQKGEAVRNADGSVSYAMTTTLVNTMSNEDAANLPDYVRAHNGNADAPSQEMLRLYLYAPFGGSISNVSSSYGTMQEATHNNLQVFFEDVRLLPGEQITVTYTVTVPAEVADTELDVRVTPTAQAAREGTAATPAEQ